MPDEGQILALRTWYPEDHEQHWSLVPSIMGVAGEAGELIDELKKQMFKPDYPQDIEKLREELVDLWYYVRIVAYQLGMTTDAMTSRSADKLLRGKHGWKDNGDGD